MDITEMMAQGSVRTIDLVENLQAQIKVLESRIVTLSTRLEALEKQTNPVTPIKPQMRFK